MFHLVDIKIMLSANIVLAVAAKKGIEKIVENYVIPKLGELASAVNTEVKDLLVPHREHFEEYLKRTYDKLETLNTIVRCNSQLKLKDIYIPLTIVGVREEKKKNTYSIDGYPKQLMDKYGKILIADTAGMGKSTMTKRIFLDIVENGYGIPMYIELRRLSKSHTLLQEIEGQLDALNKKFDRELLIRFIENGEFIFILDGYDEISFAEREIVTNDIQEFVARTSTGNRFILSSRPESALTCFGDFKSFNIQPLTRKEAYRLIKNYDVEQKNAKLLIEQLDSGKYKMIDEFLKNPLLVSLLYKAFDYKQTIPLKKHIFYRQVYDAYFDSHDLSKGGGYIHEKKTKLSTDEFNRVLRAMGYECLREYKTEFTKDKILNLISLAKKRCPNLDFQESYMLEDLLKAVPLFVQDGNYYKWAHKSLQEYFAAQFIYLDTKELQSTILEKLYVSPKRESYLNLLDLYCDIDEDGFKQHVLLRFINEYLSFRKEAISAINISILEMESLIDERVFLLYCDEAQICKQIQTSQKFKFEEAFDNLMEIWSQDGIQNKGFSRISQMQIENGILSVILNDKKDNIAFCKMLHQHFPFLFTELVGVTESGEHSEGFLLLPSDQIMPLKIDTAIKDSVLYRIINRLVLRHDIDMVPIPSQLSVESEKINMYVKARKNADFIGDL